MQLRIVGRLFFLFICGLATLAANPCSGAVTFSLSPSAISNAYSGPVTLQIAGLNSGETVLVQKFLDVNTNNVVDAGDWLVQQFTVTDGQTEIIAGVTNMNVPCDWNPSAGAITARINIMPMDFIQRTSARYLFRLSSPASQFAPVTTAFTVTNSAFAQSVTGTIRCNGTNVPNAMVLVAVGSFQHGMPRWGVMADGSGKYTVKLPVGTYSLGAFIPGYLTDLAAAPMLALGTGATISTNLSVLAPTRKITAKVVDADSPTIGLPGVMATFESQSGVIGIALADPAGNLAAAVTAARWRLNVNNADLILHGYLNPKADVWADTSTGDVTGLVAPFVKSKALIYGTVRDDQNQPLGDIELSAGGEANPYETAASTGSDGKYSLGVLGGRWNISLSTTRPGSASYVFAEANGLDLTDNQAVVQNFVAKLAPYRVSGYVKNTSNQPVGNVGVYTSATLSGTMYRAYTQTDSSGYYELYVAAGTWTVGVNCSGGNDSLAGLGYLCVSEQSTIVSTANRTVNFTVQSAPSTISGYVKDSSNNPVPNVDVYAYVPGGNQNVGGRTDGSGHYNLQVGNGTWSVGVSCNGGGLADLGYVCVNDRSVTVNDSTGIVNFTTMPAPYQVSGYVRNSNNQGVANVNVYAYATVNGTAFNVSASTDSTGRFLLKLGAGGWHVGVNCGDLTALNYQCINDYVVNIPGPSSLTFNVQPAASLQITTTFLPDGLQNSFYNQALQATGGQQAYNWYLPNGTTSLPPGLNLSPDGTLSGTPTVGGLFNFAVAVYVQSPYEVATQNLSLTIISSAPLQVLTTLLPTGSAGTAYSAQLSASGGQPPYRWSLAPGSAALPSGLSLSLDGVVGGTPATSGASYFYVRVLDSSNTSVDQLVSLSINAPPLSITSGSLPAAQVGQAYLAQLTAIGGNSPYTWSLGLGSAPLPPGISLSSDGALTGTPVSVGDFPFMISVRDMLGGSATRSLTISANAALTLGNPMRLSPTQFGFTVNGVAGLNYTAQASPDLVNWSPLFTTNATIGSFQMRFNDATNRANFYRVIATP